MSLEASFRELLTRLRHLQDELAEVRITIEDHPVGSETAAVDALENSIEDVQGHIETALRHVSNVGKVLGAKLRLYRARVILAKTDESFRTAARLFAAASSYRTLTELKTICDARGPEWPLWSETVIEAVERCRQPLQDVAAEVAHCWEDLAELAGTSTLNVATSKIGSKIG